MTLYYLDPSAWLKRYLDEPGSAAMHELFALGPAMATSSLGLIEAYATLSRRQSSRAITTAVAAEATARLDDDVERIDLVDVTGEVLARAVGFARTLSLRAGDTIHLAAAVHLRDALADTVDTVCVVSSDSELKSAAFLQRLSVLDPAH